MSRSKVRNLLVLCHLWLAGIVAPFFVLVATTGGLYLAGQKGEVATSPLSIPAGLAIDPESDALEDDVRSVIAANDLSLDFEQLRVRPDAISTRPTSGDFVTLEQADGQWSATLNQPSFVYRMIELHKGHGPKAFKIYQVLAALSLLAVVFGGLLVGLLSPAYRRATLVALGGGSTVFAVLAFVI